MARQKGIVKLEGGLGELSFYSSVFGDIVRRKGGASKEKIRRSPAFKNLRLHHAEFAGCAAAGKLLRQVLRPYTLQAPDHTLVWRVTKLMNQIKDLDTTSTRGRRSVSAGLQSPEGPTLLQGFDLNSQAPLKQVLTLPVKTNANGFYLKGLIARQHLVFPKGATAVCIRGIVALIDLDTNKQQVAADAVTLKRYAKKQDLSLNPAVPKGNGIAFYLLQLRFMQEVNGQLYELKTGNSLGIIDVRV